MQRYKTAKSYDVKSFLSAEHHKKRRYASKMSRKRDFVSLTLGRGSISVFLYILLGIFNFSVMCFLCGEGIVWKELSVKAVKSTLPFCVEDSLADRRKLSFLDTVSFLMEYNKEDKESLRPPLPVADIKTLDDSSNGIEIKNETSYVIDTQSMLIEKPRLSSANPKVLIVHTHGSESYTPSSTYNYNQTGNYRTDNTDFNMIRVGKQLAKAIKSEGVEVIHDTSINDYPSYNDSYNKTGKIIEKYLSKDKDIAIVLDIHRDALGDENNIVRLATDIGSKKAAQVMIVCGTDTNLDNPNWQQNLSLALYIQQSMEKNYPGFMRPVNLRKERFNMHLTTGSLLFEMGTNGNTLEEALYSADILGSELGKIIGSIKGG